MTLTPLGSLSAPVVPHPRVISKTFVLLIIPALENNSSLLFPRAQRPSGASQGVLWVWLSALACEVCFSSAADAHAAAVFMFGSKGRGKWNIRGVGHPF